MVDLDKSAAAGTVELHPFEKGRKSLLAAPMAVAPGVHVVLELFDKSKGAFDDADQRLVGAAADLGAELLRQTLANKQIHQVLLDAVGAALSAGDKFAETLRGSSAQRLEQPPSAPVLDQLRAGLKATTGGAVEADETLRLAEAIRVLALRHGSPAVQHCIRLVESLRTMLDSVTGT